MRLATALLFYSLSFTYAFHHHSFRNKHSSRSITLRQHHEPRAILDVCAYLDADLLANESVFGISLGIFGLLDVCLCLSNLQLYLRTDIRIKAAVDILGEQVIYEVLTSLIKLSDGSRPCNHPPNSRLLCSRDDVCGFTCNPPYEQSGDTCVCPSPNIECNGFCGSYPRGCSSSVPRSLSKSDHNSRAGVMPFGVTTLAQAQQTCEPHESVCGVPNSSVGFECLDVMKNLESCGGCIYQSPFSTSDTHGLDCTDLDGVDNVACEQGNCVVGKCKEGWLVNLAGDGCVPFDIDVDLYSSSELGPRSYTHANGSPEDPPFKKMRREMALGTVSGVNSFGPPSLDASDVLSSKRRRELLYNDDVLAAVVDAGDDYDVNSLVDTELIL